VSDLIHVLGIVGSPRTNGNTERLVAEALRVVEEKGAETELLRLAGKEVKPCDACLSCRKTGECHMKDDFQTIFDKMVKADGIILSSPVYFGSATPQIKALVDRAGYLSGAKGRVLRTKSVDHSLLQEEQVRTSLMPSFYSSFSIRE